MRVNKKEIFLGVFFLSTIFLIYLVFEVAPKKYLRVSFLNVGQGDAILFQTPRGGKILVDGGKDKKVLSELGQQLPTLANKIDLVILTHDDADHITGLIDVLKKYQVKVLLSSNVKSQTDLNLELLKVAREKNVKVVEIAKPMIVKTDDGLIIKILFPVRDMSTEKTDDDSNATSIVTQFIFYENKFMLTGDLGVAGEKYLVYKYGEDLKSDVLKLGHHGSDTSTSIEFLQKVRPTVAVASSGKNNSFGHPHRSVLEMLEKFGVILYRTDTDGEISFYSNGIKIWRD